MSNTTPSKPAAKPQSRVSRAERLAKVLRTNLKRRKDASRNRTCSDVEPDGGASSE